MIAYALYLVCEDHEAGLMQHTSQYHAPTAEGCDKKAQADGWRIEQGKAVCPNCARQQAAMETKQ